ncbi:MAG: hypothetical protein ACKVS6_04615 [Planctomycetota bacterium]
MAKLISIAAAIGIVISSGGLFWRSLPASGKQSPGENEYYRIVTIPAPDDVVLEVGGIDTFSDGTPVVCTRRGDVYMIHNAYSDPPKDITYHKFASGLHEPLGLVAEPDGIYCTQRGELTRLRDTNNDGIADAYDTICDKWSISGNYHEYAYGPKKDKNGDYWITLNLSWTDSGRSLVPWRGWAVKVNKKGEMTPVCAGLRSPSGLGMNSAGDMFYTDNQGDWNGTCSLHHMERGDFIGHPEGLKWWTDTTFQPPLPKPPVPPQGKLMIEAAAENPNLKLKLPAVWFPYPRMGQASSDILSDETGGKFGPFDKQLFVGDQTTSEITRVFLERVNGKYQGACFPFRQGFDCGIVRMCWGKDASMFVGMTNRGWGSRGSRGEGLQRLVWTGKTPFEVKEIRAAKDGFELIFTQTIDADAARDPKSYSGIRFSYLYHERYGSEEVQKADLKILSAKPGAGGKSVKLTIDGLRKGFVHELHFDGVLSAAGQPLLHRVAYYTLNEIPE